VHRTEAAVDSPLPRLVPKGGAYGYDLIAYVGCETFLRGRKLESVAREFPQIPFSSLYDVQHKFLFYFGHLHRQSAPVLAARFQRRGGGTWLIDATLEPDTPMHFGVYEAQDNVLLDAYRIPSESADAITPCLEQTAARFGEPRRVLHDLSNAMAAACERALEKVSHTVCHFHLLRDIGEDLYATPQARLRDRLRQLKLQSRLKEQRKGQTDWLREHIEHTTVLAEVLAGKRVEVSEATAGREVLMAFHQWLLDYPRDGRRQGFPFDPYLLYFHRRVVRGSTAVRTGIDGGGAVVEGRSGGGTSPAGAEEFREHVAAVPWRPGGDRGGRPIRNGVYVVPPLADGVTDGGAGRQSPARSLPAGQVGNSRRATVAGIVSRGVSPAERGGNG
jgi:hypothetical protein